MTATTKSLSQTSDPQEPARQAPAHEELNGDLASDLKRVAEAVEAVHADGYREPGEIAADDAGASRLADELNDKGKAATGTSSAL